MNIDLDPLVRNIADAVTARIAQEMGEQGQAVDVDDLVPFAGEAHGAFCARSGEEPVVPETHKWDPWFPVDPAPGPHPVGAWIPGDAPFTAPPQA